jgi:hypothetical protein
MTVIIGEQPVGTPYYMKKIRCAGHYLIPPTVDIYLREPIPETKGCSGKTFEYRGQKLKIKKERIKKDGFGRKMVDWKKLHKLRDVGIVQQPWVSAAWAVEHVYDPLNFCCAFQCKGKPCLRERGMTANTMSIKRLNG